MVCYHLAKFGGHRYCRSRDMFLFCHVIKQDYVMKGLDVDNDRSNQGKSLPCQVWWS